MKRGETGSSRAGGGETKTKDDQRVNQCDVSLMASKRVEGDEVGLLIRSEVRRGPKGM